VSRTLPETWPPGPSVRGALPPAGWDRVIRTIAARHGLGDITPAPYESGSDVVFRLGDRVLKLSAPCWADEIENEARLCAHLEGRLPFETPSPLAHGAFEGWPYVIVSRLEGVAMADVWPGLTTAERLDLAARVGEAAAALHAVPPPQEAGEDWPAFFSRMRDQLVATHRARGASEVWIERVEPFVRAVEPLPEREPVTLHTELLGEHVLLRESSDGWRVAGMIDLADGRAGHPEYDWAAPVMFVFKGQPGCLRALLSAYGYPDAALNEATSRRLLAWGLLHRFTSLPRMLSAVGAPAPVDLDALARRLYTL